MIWWRVPPRVTRCHGDAKSPPRSPRPGTGRRFAPSSGLTSGYPGLSVRTRQAPGTPGTALAHFRPREPSRVRLTLSAILPSDRALARPVCLTFTTTGRAGPIVRGVPCSDFAVLGTDRLESNPRAPSPETWRGSSGASTTDRAPPEAPAGHRHSRAGDARARPGHREVLRELTTPVERSGLDVDALVERTATAAPGSAARRTGAGEARPGGQSGQRRGGHPAEGREGHPRPGLRGVRPGHGRLGAARRRLEGATRIPAAGSGGLARCSGSLLRARSLFERRRAVWLLDP